MYVEAACVSETDLQHEYSLKGDPAKINQILFKKLIKNSIISSKILF